MNSGLFKSFFLGGFDCCTQYTPLGKRLDMLATTGHDRFAREDYIRLQDLGIRTARDGVRWHLIERSPGRYDFSSILWMVRAARETQTQVIYDLCHYGWPDDIDIFKPEFVRRFARYARAVVSFLSNESDEIPFIVPINEISFSAWGAADVGCLFPFNRGRGLELKVQLVRAAIEGIEAIWSVVPRTRIVQVDPVINIVADPERPQDRAAAEGRRLALYEAWDMLSGRVWPQLGGDIKYLDIVGVNFYPHNQWTFHNNETIPRSDGKYRPFRDIVREVYLRYGRPIFISETGGIGDERVDWLRYMGEEVRAAIRGGTPLEGICLYPILNYPGWDDNRMYEHGLWDYPDEQGDRPTFSPLAEELRRQVALMDRVLTGATAYRY